MTLKKYFVFIFCCYSFQLYAQFTVPDIHTIAAKFYNTYSIATLQYPVVAFEKRKTGWTVTTKKVVNGELENDKSYLMYDAAIAVFYELPIDKKTNDVVVDYKNYIDEFQLRNYALHPFYGYAGWYKDVINLYSNETNLNDSALYSLARAYSTYASCLLSNQTGDAVKAEMFNLSFSSNCMNAEQLNLYNTIAQNAVQSFKKLALQNPNFQTPVGSIAIKYANEAMVQFYTCLVYSKDLINSFVLPENLYADSIVQQVKGQLSACPNNAVFLSFGDNDFYPFLYVQQKLGFRKDVYVINENLLSLDRYIYAATQPQLSSTAIKLSFDTSYYKGSKNDYLLLNLNDSTIAFKKLIETIKINETTAESVLKINANIFQLKKENNFIEIPFNVPYILKSNWVLLDIIYNLGTRKLCTNNLFYSPYKVLNKFLTKAKNDIYIL